MYIYREYIMKIDDIWIGTLELFPTPKDMASIYHSKILNEFQVYFNRPTLSWTNVGLSLGSDLLNKILDSSHVDGKKGYWEGRLY